jgi:hypothetical protein
MLAEPHEIEASKRIVIVDHLHAAALCFEGFCVLLSPANVIAEYEYPETPMGRSQLSKSSPIVCDIAGAVVIRHGLPS